jgi:hypothetical protein|uniref:Uncharacterized protein n=1 Tax=Bacteriophage sp. TaxID=38018 RepID=A0A7G9A473_9VIRU|nr:MAG: hypothetical protein [Bacteriophage sp.]
MKEISTNYWAPHNHYGAPHNDYLWDAPIPITNPPIANGDTLYYRFYVYNAGMFYYILTLFAKDNFYKDN